MRRIRSSLNGDSGPAAGDGSVSGGNIFNDISVHVGAGVRALTAQFASSAAAAATAAAVASSAAALAASSSPWSVRRGSVNLTAVQESRVLLEDSPGGARAHSANAPASAAAATAAAAVPEESASTGPLPGVAIGGQVSGSSAGSSGGMPVASPRAGIIIGGTPRSPATRRVTIEEDGGAGSPPLPSSRGGGGWAGRAGKVFPAGPEAGVPLPAHGAGAPGSFVSSSEAGESMHGGGMTTVSAIHIHHGPSSVDGESVRGTKIPEEQRAALQLGSPMSASSRFYASLLSSPPDGNAADDNDGFNNDSAGAVSGAGAVGGRSDWPLDAAAAWTMPVRALGLFEPKAAAVPVPASVEILLDEAIAANRAPVAAALNSGNAQQHPQGSAQPVRAPGGVASPGPLPRTLTVQDANDSARNCREHPGGSWVSGVADAGTAAASASGSSSQTQLASQLPPEIRERTGPGAIGRSGTASGSNCNSNLPMRVDEPPPLGSGSASSPGWRQNQPQSPHGAIWAVPSGPPPSPSEASLSHPTQTFGLRRGQGQSEDIWTNGARNAAMSAAAAKRSTGPPMASLSVRPPEEQRTRGRSLDLALSEEDMREGPLKTTRALAAYASVPTFQALQEQTGEAQALEYGQQTSLGSHHQRVSPGEAGGMAGSSVSSFHALDRTVGSKTAGGMSVSRRGGAGSMAAALSAHDAHAATAASSAATRDSDHSVHGGSVSGGSAALSQLGGGRSARRLLIGAGRMSFKSRGGSGADSDSADGLSCSQALLSSTQPPLAQQAFDEQSVRCVACRPAIRPCVLAPPLPPSPPQVQGAAVIFQLVRTTASRCGRTLRRLQQSAPAS